MNAVFNETDRRDVLSQDDLLLVTGATYTKKQAEVLERAGIFFWYDLNGKIKTCWYHVHHPKTEQQTEGFVLDRSKIK